MTRKRQIIEEKLSGIQTADEDDSNEVPNDSVSDESHLLSEDVEQRAITEETSDTNQEIDQLDTLHETEN